MSVVVDGIIFSLQRYGGISVYTRELLRYLDQEHEPYVLTLETPTLQDDIAKGPNVVARRARTLERIRRCRLPAGSSVFHSSYYRQPDGAGVPSVVTVHDFVHERFRHDAAALAHRLQKHAAIRAASAIICISQATRDELLHWIGPTPGQQVYVIHNGVSETFRPVRVSRNDRPFVLYVGERRGYKNFALVMAAMRRLPNIELHCVGGGPLQPDELEAADVNDRERIRHRGFVTEEQLNQLYNDAICLAYPSSHEGFGIPVIEAMRAGCPVVVVNCQAVLEVGGDALAIAEGEDGDAVARAIEQTLDPDRRQALISAGLRNAARFSWDLTHRRTVEVYRSLQVTRD